MNTTKNALDYYHSIVHRLQEYTKPLKHLDIQTFGYLKLLPDGRYLHITDNIKLTNDYITKIGDVQLNKGSFRTLNLNEKKTHFIDTYNTCSTVPMQIMAEHDVWNGILKIKSLENYFEMLWFGGNKTYDVPYMHGNNKNFLQQFTIYFKTQAIDIINTDHSNFRPFEPYPELISENTKPFLKNSKKAEQFLREIEIPHIKIHTPQGTLKISMKEAQCLKLLSKAYSIKEIAAILKISPRTAETHFYNLRCKTSCASKQKLIYLYTTYLSEYFEL